MVALASDEADNGTGQKMKLSASEITPESLYLNRRQFLSGVGGAAAVAAFTAACAAPSDPGGLATDVVGVSSGSDLESAAVPQETVAGEPPAVAANGEPLTPFEDVTGFNNFYEFTLSKQAVARLSAGFAVEPWTLTVGGLVRRPNTYSISDLTARYGVEERIYRFRCVETWSMVIPWLGFSLGALLRHVEPESSARFVRFETMYDPEQMPGQRSQQFRWPYVEGLRLDEAMHDLTILSTGLYGKVLLPQNGAPLRLVVPWKYGFKSIKSIVRIDLVEEMPTSLWMAAAPDEYGFYANVNPDVSHPRWSQATESRVGEQERRPTQIFNGYGEQVAVLYTGMDLAANF